MYASSAGHRLVVVYVQREELSTDVPALQVATLMEEGGGINNSGIRPIDFMASVYSMFCQGRVHGVGCGQGPFVFL